MKIVSFYEIAPDALSKVMTHYPAHRARLDEFHARGVIFAAGPLGNPPEGAMAVFTTREAAEEFIRGDPLRNKRAREQMASCRMERSVYLVCRHRTVNS